MHGYMQERRRNELCLIKIGHLIPGTVPTAETLLRDTGITGAQSRLNAVNATAPW